MNLEPDDPKQDLILNSAWFAFAAYGFRKTSMEDIAQGAGMSRPALYTHYRNKHEIFRTLVQVYYDKAALDVSEALRQHGSPQEQLERAVRAQGADSVEAMLSSPHGLELLDTGTAHAADLVEAGEARLRSLYEGWLTEAAQDERITLCAPADAVADMLTSALKGIKSSGLDYQSYCQRAGILARMIGAGLMPSR